MIVEILSGMRRKRSHNQCHLTLFSGIKRELARTQTTLTSRIVNVTDVLNLKYIDIVFIKNDRISIDKLLIITKDYKQSSLGVAAVKLFNKIVEKCP